MPNPCSGPALRIHDPQGAAADLYLRDFFETFVRPRCLKKSVSAGTLKWYRSTITFFEAALCLPPLPKPPKQRQRRGEWEARRDELRQHGRGDPLLSELDAAESIRTFETWLEAHVAESNTRRTHLVNLLFLLRRAGPKKGRGEYAELLLEEPPEIELPDLIVRDVVDQFTLKELGYFLDACEVATWRKKSLPLPAPVFVRNLVLFDYNVGLRLGTLLAARHDWRREDEHGSWLAIPPAAMKGHRRGLVVYLNRHAVQIADRMRSLGSELMFPYPCGEGHLERLRREILSASRIPPPRQDELGFHSLRKACGTQLARFNPLAAKLQLGHAGGVTENHYINRATILPEPCEALPQPVWDGRQRRLF